MSIRERVYWLRPSTKQAAFTNGVMCQPLGEWWYAQEVWKSVRPSWKSSFWAGVYPILVHLEAEGVIESGREELPPDDPRAAHPRYKFRRR